MAPPSPDHPNFFDLLELDPDVLWESEGKKKYEQQLEKMRAKWTNMRDAPGTAGENAKRFLALYNSHAIQDVMESAPQRESEAQACRLARADKRNQLQQILEDWKKHADTVTKRQINRWSSEVGMSPAEVEAAAVAIGLAITKDGAPSGSAKTRLDPVTLADVRAKLTALKRLNPSQTADYETLYTFMGASATMKGTELYTLPADPSASSAEDLQKAAVKLNEYLQRNPNKNEDLTARIELAGQAMTLFKTAASKRGYDEALRLEPLGLLLDEMERKTGGERPRAPHIKAYYEGALRAKFSQDDAQEELAARAIQRNWGTVEAPQEFKRCPFCDELISADTNSCPECGKLLTLTCPNCDRAGVDVEAMACPGCGFPTGQRAVVEDVINDALDALGKRDFATARRYAADARRMWRPGRPDDIAKRIDSLDAQLQRHDQDLKAQQAQDLLNKAQAAIIAGDRATAQRYIDQVNTLGLAGDASIATRIKEIRVLEAQQTLNKAEGAIRADKYADAQAGIDEVMGMGVASEDAIAERIAELKTLWAQQLLTKASREATSLDFSTAQRLIDQVVALGVAEQQPIADRITALHVQRGQQLLNRAESALRNAQYDPAFDLLGQVKMMSEAGASPLKERIAALEAKLASHAQEIQEQKARELDKERQRQEQIRDTLTSIEGSITNRNLVAAQKRLESLPVDAQNLPEVVALKQRIEQGMRAADERVRLARGVTSEEARVEECFAALDICADHAEALELLQATRPRTLEQVTTKVSASQDTVTISWKASAEKGVTYSVVRKAGAPPATASDGDLIARSITVLTYLDNHPPIGVELYYAVFAKRARVERYSLPALAPEPLVLARDVVEARAEAGDRSVALTWKAPDRAVVTVRRKQNAPPMSATDGDLVPLNSPNSALDKSLANGTTYYYRISCAFAGRVTSAGVVVSATPHMRPSAPPPLKISGQLNHVNWCDVELQWGDEPRGPRGAESMTGRKVIYRTDNATLFKQGATYSVSEVAPYIWRELPIENGRANDQLARPDVVTYVPAIIVQDRVYSGAPQEYRFIPGLEQVEAQSAVGAIRLAWKWPPHIQEAVIAWGTSLPENPLQAPGATVVARKDEERGEHEVPSPAGKRISLALASIIRPDGRPDGRAVMDKAHVVEGKASDMGEIIYEFVRPSGGLFKKKVPNHTLRLRVRNPGPLLDIPPLRVIYKEGKVPADVNDGVYWADFGKQPIMPGDIPLALPGLTGKRGVLYGAVFFADSAHARAVKLSSAGEDKIKL